MLGFSFECECRLTQYAITGGRCPQAHFIWNLDAVATGCRRTHLARKGDASLQTAALATPAAPALTSWQCCAGTGSGRHAHWLWTKAGRCPNVDASSFRCCQSSRRITLPGGICWAGQRCSVLRNAPHSTSMQPRWTLKQTICPQASTLPLREKQIVIESVAWAQRMSVMLLRKDKPESTMQTRPQHDWQYKPLLVPY